MENPETSYALMKNPEVNSSLINVHIPEANLVNPTSMDNPEAHSSLTNVQNPRDDDAGFDNYDHACLG